jgi:hypothetical protein
VQSWPTVIDCDQLPLLGRTRKLLSFSLLRRTMAPRSIYVIRSKHNVVKVGIATRPRLRLLNLQSASHSPLCLDYTATVAGDARVLEIHVHKALESRRVSGEWFGIASSRAISVQPERPRLLDTRSNALTYLRSQYLLPLPWLLPPPHIRCPSSISPLPPGSLISSERELSRRL